jgi:hypothetical protein
MLIRAERFKLEFVFLDRTEKKIDSLRFIESRIRRGECELARRKCAEFATNHLDGAINSRQLLPINFPRSFFSG